IVRLLLEQGASPHYQTHRFRDSLLTMAQDREYRELAQLFLEIAARQFPVREGLDAFLKAACRGDVAAVESAIASDPAIARASTDTGDTALHQAAAGGHLRVMRALLDAGANPDAGRADGHRPIHCALDSRRLGPLHAGVAAGMLLARGAA